MLLLETILFRALRLAFHPCSFAVKIEITKHFSPEVITQRKHHFSGLHSQFRNITYLFLSISMVPEWQILGYINSARRTIAACMNTAAPKGVSLSRASPCPFLPQLGCTKGVIRPHVAVLWQRLGVPCRTWCAVQNSRELSLLTRLVGWCVRTQILLTTSSCLVAEYRHSFLLPTRRRYPAGPASYTGVYAHRRLQDRSSGGPRPLPAQVTTSTRTGEPSALYAASHPRASTPTCRTAATSGSSWRCAPPWR